MIFEIRIFYKLNVLELSLVILNLKDSLIELLEVLLNPTEFDGLK
jgi:hypothetical protein